MGIAHAHGVVLDGVQGSLVRVEVEVATGLPSVGVVGLPDTSVSESRWRSRSAILATGATWPNQRVTINLSPAEVRKLGAGLDLPIAVGILAASDQLPSVDLAATAFIGELGLDGRLHATRGVLAGALAVQRAGVDRVIVPREGSHDLARLPGVRVLPAHDLGQVVAILRGDDVGDPLAPDGSTEGASSTGLDLRDVRGHEHARFALEVAAAGGHNVALVGPPGVGKTLLVDRLPGILPDLTQDDALEVASIASVAGAPRSPADFTRPPFQSPHHSASSAALLGAVHGARVVPGSVTLAHRGLLFLDEATEFARPVLEGLRQPLESGVLRLARSGWSGLLPAAFQLVLAANPCPCGQRSVAKQQCSCPPAALRRYAARLAGPLLDRIDIRLAVSRPPAAELGSSVDAESTAEVSQRVRVARERCQQRLAGTPWAVNARVPAPELRRRFPLSGAAAEVLRDLERTSPNLRGPDRVLRLAWTIADLSGHDQPDRSDVARAATLRGATLPWSA